MIKFFTPILLVSFIVFVSNVTSAQTAMIDGANLNICSGTILDPGGLTDYPNNSNVTTTICPSTVGASVQLDFTSFNTEMNFDNLTIYDGNSTVAPILGTYGGVLAAFSVQASSPSGCLTLVFNSDAANVFSGFSADVSCVFPCQTINAIVNSTTPAVTNGFIDLCLGQTINVVGSGNYPNSPGAYTQSDATSSFEWNFGDLSISNTASSSHTYTTSGVFDLDLNITDINGCENTNDINIKVRVSDEPTFNGTAATSLDICIGQDNDLTGFIQSTPITYYCESTSPDTTVIPDGVGVSYTNELNLDCFTPASVITSASDIASVCIDIEHSYIHDLTMTLTCPNGTSIDLYVSYPGASNDVQFGQPVDDDLSTTLGNPFNYCFTNTATSTIYSVAEPAVGLPPTHSYTDNDGTVVTADYYVPAGNYSPDQSFTNLIGCPLNGDWTVTITDGLNSDNGAVFNWSIDFDPSLYASNNNYTPLVNGSWLPDPTINSTTGNSINVTPTVVGNACYTYQSQDEFGCTYDTLVCFNVTNIEDPSFSYAQAQFCVSSADPNPIIAGTNGGTFSANNGLPINATTGVIDLSASTVGTYTIQYVTPGLTCADSSTFNLTIVEATANFSVDFTSGCAPLTVNFTNLSPSSTNCLWDFGDGNTFVGCSGVSNIYVGGGVFSPALTITDNNGCVATFNQNGLIQPEIKPIAAFIPSPSQISVIDQTSSMINTSTGATSYSWSFPDMSTTIEENPSFTFDLAGNEDAIVTLFAFSDGGCVDSTSRTITLQEDLIFYAPNAFTPGNDEFNNVFNPKMNSGFDISSYKLTIRNRWGEEVFISKDINVGWDGTNKSGRMSSDGIYTYVIQFNRKNVDSSETFEGHVNLLR